MPYDDYPDDRGARYAVGFVNSLVVAVLWFPAFFLRGAGRFLREISTESWPRANGSITAGT